MKIVLFVITLVLVMIASSETFAQTTTTTSSSTSSCLTCGDDDPPPGADLGDPGTEVPIDGGLSLLLVAGAAYGAKRIHRNSKMKTE